jgi:pimeloyl-ACP methyl ester carboxylesterase/DNA-binding CsgD family transcriptional regulator
LRTDERGCGLSDRDVAEISFEALVRDLEAVVDAAGLERFCLFGTSQGGAMAIEYAARHPERVSHLVLLGSYARGWLRRGLAKIDEEMEARLKLVDLGWERDDPTYRQMFISPYVPTATLEQLRSMIELVGRSAPASSLTQLIRCLFAVDVQSSARQVKCPTLLLHAQRDRRVPLEEGRVLGSLIPDARLVVLDSDNHLLLPQEPAFGQFFAELDAFLPGRASPARAHFPALTAREAEILEHIARGLDNAQIAARLGLSEKTVRNHITHIFDKLQVENRAQAIVLARDNGLGAGEP